jgi:3-phosphoshikimate 1-carboxyvinyltransferase
VAALLVPGSEILLHGVGVNPTRTGLLELLTMMGATIEQRHLRQAGGEPIADLLVRHGALRGIDVPPELIPRAIDEFPIFCVAAALADGETRLSGAAELRVKESDRIHAMAVGLQALGVEVTELADGLHIIGRPEGLPGGVTVDSFTDHRIAMSLLVAGLRCHEPVVVQRCANIQTSFPTFQSIMSGLGATLGG